MNWGMVWLVGFLSLLVGVAIYHDPVMKEREDVIYAVRDCAVSIEQLDRASRARYRCTKFPDGTRLVSRSY